MEKIDELRRELLSCETEIMKMTSSHRPDYYGVHYEKRKELENLFRKRKGLLNAMFRVTPETVSRLETVNNRLKEISSLLNKDALYFYDTRISDPEVNKRFRDGNMQAFFRFEYLHDRDTVLVGEDDAYYGSNFKKMLEILSYEEGFGYDKLNEQFVTIDPDHPMASATSLLDIKDDDESWAETWMQHPEFDHIKFCYAIYELLCRNLYSFPDVLRMKWFWYEIRVSYQSLLII